MLKELKIINLTPHDVNIVNENGGILKTFPKSEKPARVETFLTEGVGIYHEGVIIKIKVTRFGEVFDLPERETGAMFIVSRMVIKALRGYRRDLLVPAELVRNEKGQIVGCKSLSS